MLSCLKTNSGLPLSGLALAVAVGSLQSDQIRRVRSSVSRYGSGAAPAMQLKSKQNGRLSLENLLMLAHRYLFYSDFSSAASSKAVTSINSSLASS